MNTVEQIVEVIKKSDNIVFFGGAGVSTESGIPDFRSVDGLYNEKYDYPPETILSHTFYRRKTSEFYRFYKDKMICKNAKPNVIHNALAKLEKEGKVKAIVTQNIDGLHQLAGSKEVLELHGSVHRNYCEECGRFFDANYILDANDVPKCDAESCNGFVKPDVVLYEEGLDNEIIRKSIEYIKNADVLIVGGTSLVVYPAAGLVDYYRGKKLILINKGATSKDSMADYIYQGNLSDVFSKL